MSSEATAAASHVGRDERITAVYLVTGPEAEARRKAECICIDQTVEAAEEVLTPEIRSRIVGRLEQLRPVAAACHEATVSYAADLAGRDCAGLLNLLFGTSSLRSGIRLLSWELPPETTARWRGPRFGLDGLRDGTCVRDRALVCAVLKPLGRSPRDLADLALRFVLGGVDLIKDDQGLMDQPFCPFEERVARCAEAVAQGAAQRGRPCLYLAHVSGPADDMRRRAGRAKEAGAGGLLVAPGLNGFDALRVLAEDDKLALPIASHPSLLGTYTVREDSGLAPAVLYGQLPRVAGADLSIYPGSGTGYAMTKQDCVAIATTCRASWQHFRSTAPTAAGRVGPEQVQSAAELYGRDVVFILGSRIQQHSQDLISATAQFMKEVERCTGA
jgi:ribulose-bisphosphate carboxylase large chain